MAVFWLILYISDQFLTLFPMYNSCICCACFLHLARSFPSYHQLLLVGPVFLLDNQWCCKGMPLTLKSPFDATFYALCIQSFCLPPDCIFSQYNLTPFVFASIYWMFSYCIVVHEIVYSWIADQRHSHEKSICQRTRRVTTLSRPPLESSRRGESRSVRSIFV